jgi:hypothetical protein
MILGPSLRVGQATAFRTFVQPNRRAEKLRTNCLKPTLRSTIPSAVTPPGPVSMGRRDRRSLDSHDEPNTVFAIGLASPLFAIRPLHVGRTFASGAHSWGDQRT